MAVNKVDLYVSQILEDLDNGLTWLKSDDIGYGSIQEKYNAKEMQITVIRKGNAKLRNAETNITIFNIIDDTKNETTNKTRERRSTSNNIVEQREVDMADVNPAVEVNKTTDELAAFVNL